MKKKFQVKPAAADDAKKFKTLNDLQVVVLLAFTASGAVLYVKKCDGPASVIRRGAGHELDSINKRAVISIADYSFNDFGIIVTTPNQADFVIHNSDDGNGPTKGAVLFYGKPSGKKIHVRIVCSRSSSGACPPFKIKDINELWILPAVVEPLLLSWGFRFDWVRFVEMIYGITIIINNNTKKDGETDA